MKKISISEYQKIMNGIIDKKLSVEETLIVMLEEATKYEIIEDKTYA